MQQLPSNQQAAPYGGMYNQTGYYNYNYQPQPQPYFPNVTPPQLGDGKVIAADSTTVNVFEKKWEDMAAASCSRPNFSWKIVQDIFRRDELKNCCTYGSKVMQKGALEKRKLNAVKTITF